MSTYLNKHNVKNSGKSGKFVRLKAKARATEKVRKAKRRRILGKGAKIWAAGLGAAALAGGIQYAAGRSMLRTGNVGGKAFGAAVGGAALGKAGRLGMSAGGITAIYGLASTRKKRWHKKRGTYDAYKALKRR